MKKFLIASPMEETMESPREASAPLRPTASKRMIKTKFFIFNLKIGAGKLTFVNFRLLQI